MRRKIAAIAAAVMFAALTTMLSGCAQPPVLQQPVSLADGWAKAGAADGMTGLFGALQNEGDEDLTVQSIESDSATSVELHEVVDGQMRQIEGEVTIHAGGVFELAPGANHIMLMGLTHDLQAGDSVTLTVYFTNGSDAIITALVKDYAGANEDYDGSGHDMHDMSAMSEDHEGHAEH